MEEIKYHKILAYFFESKPLYLDKSCNEKPNIRKLVEQPWQQINGQLFDAVKNTLTDPEFLDVKCKAFPLNIDNLLDDLILILINSRNFNSDQYLYRQLFNIIWSEGHVVRQFPDLLIQQLWNRLRWKTDFPTDIQEKFAKYFEFKRSKGFQMLVGTVPFAEADETPAQLLNFKELPATLTITSEGLLTVDKYGHWYLINENGKIENEGEITPDAINKLCFQDNTCVALAGSIIAFWKNWPANKPFLFQTGWPIKDISFSANKHLLVVGESGEWIIYDLNSEKPSRLLAENIGEKILCGNISDDGKYLIFGTEDLNLKIFEQNRFIHSIKTEFQIIQIEVSNDNNTILCLSTNGNLNLYNLNAEQIFKEDPGLVVNHACFIPFSNEVLAVASTGECLKIFKDNNVWKSIILINIHSYLTWVGRFINEGPVIILDNSGVFRFIKIGEYYSPNTVNKTLPKNIIGIVPRGVESSILATADGKFWHFKNGNNTYTSLTLNDENPLIGICDLHDKRILVSYHLRFHSYLAQINLDSDKLKIQNVGPAETEECYDTSVMWVKTSSMGKFALIGSNSLTKTSHGTDKLKLEMYETKQWRKVQEKWLDGWDARAAVSDNGSVAVFDSKNRNCVKVYDEYNNLEDICNIHGGDPVAFDKNGNMLLIIDHQLSAWVFKKPWTSEPILLGKLIRSSCMSQNGQMVVLIDEYGYAFLLKISTDTILSFIVIAKYVLGWIPLFCEIYPELSEIYLAGETRFQILSWNEV